MVPEKLLAYLREQKQKGYPDAMVKDQFRQRGWPTSVLDEAYRQINGINNDSVSDAIALANLSTTPVPQTNTPDNTVMEPATQASEVSEIPKKWLLSATVMFILLAEHYSGHAARLTLLMIILQSAVSKQGGVFSVLSSYPTLFVASFLSLAVGVYYLYLSMRARTFSERSRQIGIISLVSIPFIYYPIINLLTLPLFRQVAEMNNSNASLLLPGTDILYSLALGYIYWKTKALHNNPDKGITRKVQIWLGVISVVSIMIFIGSGAILIKSSDMGDLDFAAVSSQVDHKLYSLSTLPANLTYSTKYELSTESDGTQLVKIALGTPIAQVGDGNSVTVIVSQQKSPSGYDILSEFVDYPTQPQSVNVPIAVDQVAYYGKKTFGKGFLGNLVFVTPEGVLIHVMGPSIELPILLEVASSLQ